VLFLLIGPGVLLHGLLSPRRRAVELPLYAAASWVIAFWWLRMLPMGWRWPVLLLGAGSLAAGLALRKLPDLPSAAVWAAAAAAFTLLYRSALVAPGVDGAMHTAVARVLADAHGHPAGFRPLWPLDFFHSYPVGQPTLTALLAELGGLSWRQAGLAGHALAYALIIVAFAAALSRWASGNVTGLVAGVLAVLAARAPLHFWTWGGAPNALGIAFGVAALAAGLDAFNDARSAAACGLFAAASLLTHGTTAAAFCYAGLPLTAAALWLRPALRRGVFRLAAAGGLALLLCVPYLASLDLVLGPREVLWVKETARQAASLRVFPQMLSDLPLIAGAAALLLVLARQPARALFPLGLAAAIALLVLNGRSFTLPLSVLLYPDRVAVLLLLPLAFLCHDALAGRPRLAVLCIAGLLVHAATLQTKTLRAGADHALATEADLRLIESLPDCPILNNYGDAGQWIPALAARPITFPQVNVLFFDEIASGVHPCAAFRGEKRPYFTDALPCPGPLCESVRKEGNAELFRIVDPAFWFEISAYR
jgi:hypothetical protein